MCECGNVVFIKKTAECRDCYYARYKKENREKYREYSRVYRAKQPPALIVYTAAVPPTTPCTYPAAHLRVLAYRGKASERVCPCGEQAQEWSYRGGSTYEQIGRRRKLYDSGRYGLVLSMWSSNITDYDALCRHCHLVRDGRRGIKEDLASLPVVPEIERPQIGQPFFYASPEAPAAATTFLSPSGGTDDR